MSTAAAARDRRKIFAFAFWKRSVDVENQKNSENQILKQKHSYVRKLETAKPQT
jgi:hypothetical protein